MAIFIASTKSISRGKGQSAVASASYRAGVELQDERYGKKHDYSNRFGVMSADIILPSSLKNIGATIERGELWNKAEQAENRKDARVAREWLVNLPYELDEQQRKELAHQFSQELADRYGVIADCAIHEPTQKEIDRGADARNFHAHIMLTTRKAELNDNNEIVLTDKSTAELSDKKRRELKLERMSHEVKEVRQLWERVANEKLAEHGIELIDSRSYKDRQLDIEPQLKMGSVATKKERDKYERELRKAKEAQKKGEHYEIDNTPVTVPGQINAIIKERNELVFNSRKREQKNDRLRTAIDRAARAIDDSKRAITAVNQAIIRRKQNTASFFRTTSPSPYDEQYRASVDRRERATEELDEQAARFNQLTKRTARESEYRKSETALISNSVRAIAHKTSILFAGRNNKTFEYTDEQRELLNDFATKHNLATGDFRKDITVARTFFENTSNIEKHRDIYKLIHKPEQCDINEFKASKTAYTALPTDKPIPTPSNDVKTSNNANESVTATRRRYRR